MNDVIGKNLGLGVIEGWEAVIQPTVLQPALADAAAVTIVGDPRLADLYTQAFARSDVTVQRLDGDACVLAGLA
jgi:2-dehydro-3-deoxygalactonokinase